MQLTEIIKSLVKDVPREKLAQRKQGGTNITYIPWYHVASLLDQHAPGWQGTVTRLEITQTHAIVSYAIAIPHEGGVTVRESTGSEPLKSSGYGEPTEVAEQTAFKRAAAKWGLGRYLYDKEGRADYQRQGDRYPSQTSQSGNKSKPKPKPDKPKPADTPKSQKKLTVAQARLVGANLHLKCDNDDIGSFVTAQAGPDAKADDLSDKQMREVLWSMCNDWSQRAGIFKHQNHIANSWVKHVSPSIGTEDETAAISRWINGKAGMDSVEDAA